MELVRDPTLHLHALASAMQTNTELFAPVMHYVKEGPEEPSWTDPSSVRLPESSTRQRGIISSSRISFADKNRQKQE